MNILRWIIGVVAAVLISGALFSLVLYVTSGVDVWADRARKLRQLGWAVVLFWFNIEIWGRVLWTIIHWNG